mgnify:CR=1 FL=1
MAFHPSQLEAIQHRDGPMLVLAGPGSGKTTVITHRVKYLIEHHQVDPSAILVVTFTKAAAREMQERFEKLMDVMALAGQLDQRADYATIVNTAFAEKAVEALQ